MDEANLYKCKVPHEWMWPSHGAGASYCSVEAKELNQYCIPTRKIDRSLPEVFHNFYDQNKKHTTMPKVINNNNKGRPNNLNIFICFGYTYDCEYHWNLGLHLIFLWHNLITYQKKKKRYSNKLLQIFVSVILNSLCLYKGLIPDKDLK